MIRGLKITRWNVTCNPRGTKSELPSQEYGRLAYKGQDRFYVFTTADCLGLESKLENDSSDRRRWLCNSLLRVAFFTAINNVMIDIKFEPRDRCYGESCSSYIPTSIIKTADYFLSIVLNRRFSISPIEALLPVHPMIVEKPSGLLKIVAT